MQEDINIQKPKSKLDYMMTYGLYLGLFLAFNYSFLILRQYWETFIYFNSILKFVPPILMYVFYLRYLAQSKKKNSVKEAITFIVGMCFFASILKVAMMFIHYTYFDSSLLINSVSGENLDKMIEVYQKMGFSETVIEQMKIQLSNLNFVKFSLLLAGMLEELFMGLIFGILIGLLLKQRK